MLDKTKEILKGAVATNRGWVDKLTGELLVSIRGLPNAVEWSREFIADLKAGKEVVVELVDDVKEEIAETVEEIKEIVADKDTKSKKKKTPQAEAK